MSDSTPITPPPYEDIASASVIYFDVVAANGVMNGAVQIELAQRILVPIETGGVQIKFACSGTDCDAAPLRPRC